MNYLLLTVVLFGIFTFGYGNPNGKADPAWCAGYSKYCSYSSIMTQCPVLCNASSSLDPSWCEYYKPYCAGNPSIQAQCPHTCNVIIHGKWGYWSAWNACPVSCGSGIQIRSRLCDNPAPTHGGRKCEMTDGAHGVKETQSRPCESDYCPIHGGYSDWSPYSKCSKSCGGGIKYRNRCCINPFPKNGGRDCSILGSPVEASVCNPMPCPIHGMYGNWSDYGGCTKSCGGGIQYKMRSCNSPAPLFGGRNCSMFGPDKESRPCNVQPCPIHGGYTDWTEYSKCSKTCGGGLRYRSRCCVSPMPAFGGKSCDILGEPVEVEVCEAQPCHIDGNWSDWLEWGVCTDVCGSNGIRMRRRKCDNPKPLFAGKDCPGPPIETLPCNRVKCAIDGGFTQWSVWSQCSVSCGPGIRTTARTCTNPVPSNGGKFCIGPTTKSERCNAMDCPVNGGYSDWSNWSACSATCGEAIMSRSRTCTSPTPANGGLDCVGDSNEIKLCTLQKCPEYKYGLDLLSWPNAENTCKNWGGHLATIMDQAELDHIIKGFAAAGVTLSADAYAWIGLQDMVITNEWRWIDGTPKNSFAPWSNGEPSHSGHHCVSMNLMSKTWWDRNCPTLYQYVCKK